MGFLCVQTSESCGNGKTTLENGGRNPPDVTLDDIAKDLLTFFNRVECLRKTKNNIEEKYDIKNESGDYWSADDIKRAWGKTQRMDKKSDKRKHWARVIMLQILKRLVSDGCKQNAAQEDRDDTTNETKQSCEKTPRIKETKATIVNTCEQRKRIDNHEELNFTDMPNQKKSERDNGRGEDGLCSTVDIKQACGKAERMKGNSEGRSSQSSAELETVDAAGGAKQSSGVNRKSSKSGPNQTDRASQEKPGARSTAGSQDTRNDPSSPDDQSGTDSSDAESEEAENHTVVENECIYIPLTKLFLNEPTAADAVVQNVRSPYKLIDGFPSDTDIRKRKSYTMSFSNVTNNAEWVYEILNRETLVDNCKKLKPFGPDYHKGHLAAAGNHRWCREANNDTYLISNIIPQHKKLNQSIWKTSEILCREKAEKYNVHVYSGPIYLSKDTGGVYTRVPNPSEMDRLEVKTIPTHLFKVIIVEYEDGTVEKPECYVMPNEEPEYEDLIDYKCEIEYIEKVSGLTFIKRCHNANMTDHIKSVTLQGECLKEELRTANIKVRISS